MLLCYSHAENSGLPTLLYVTPNPDIPCPEMPCLTLSQYAEDQDLYFGTDDIELHFLSGVHRLSSPIVIEGEINDTKLALVREAFDQNGAVIITGEQASVKLVEMKFTRIESLHFSGVHIFVGNSSNLTMNNLQFTAVNESAFDLENVDSITGVNITMTKSSGAFSAGIFRFSNVVFSNMTVENNSGDSILVIEESFVHFKEISTFANNSAIKGSTLMIKTSTVTFDGSILFQSNSCKKSKGGAMNIVNSTVTVFGQAELQGNSAGDGGAIHLTYSILKMNGMVDVSDNWVTKRSLGGHISGGAINSIQSNITMTGTVTFKGNQIRVLLLIGFGGAIYAQKSIIMLSGTTTFHRNAAGGLTNYGGAIILSNSTLIATNAVLTFTNNSAQKGGAIAITGLPSLQFFNPFRSVTVVKVEGTSVFDANAATVGGGDLFGEYQVMYILFSGNTTMSRYTGLSPLTSGQVSIIQTTMSDIQFHGYTEIKDSYSTKVIVFFRGNVSAVFSGVTKFTNNTSLEGGFMLNDDASIAFFGQTHFESNHGGVGGIITLENSRPSMISGEFLFQDNDSGMHLLNTEIKFEGDFKFNFITKCISDPRYGCITALGSTITINGSFLMNSGNIANTVPAIYSYNTSFKMYGNCKFINHNNRLGDGGTVFSLRSMLYFDGNISFISNSASGRGGAICALYSELFLRGNHVYANNIANTGGVISLGILTVIHFSGLAVIFDNNRAERGAIFHHDDILNAIDCLDDASIPFVVVPFSVRTECFFSEPFNVIVTNIGNNIASDVGNVIFGGNLERCNRKDAAETFINLFHTDDSILNVTSNPYQVVFCKDKQPITTTRLRKYSTIAIKTIPGKLFTVSVAGLNQLLKPISSTVRAEISKSSFPAAQALTRLGSFQSSQLTGHSCTTLNYRVFTQASHVNLTLYAEGPCNKLGSAAVVMEVELGSCPDGFQLAGDECMCEADLLKYTIVCNIDDESIQNSGNFWAGGLYDDNGSYVGIVAFPNCPFDYCVKAIVNFTLRDPDKQCAHNRSGSICGQCMENYSLTFGDVQCSDCSKINPGVTLGLLVLFALVGIILVILLILLKMTVASGTLNGLIFYANIVDANRDIFIPQGGWLRVFISWLNLDFGFSTCFYSGMDMYGYTWLQFLFPFYIWMLIVILIVISRRSAWVTKRVGSNPVAVLATLILLSYAKLLRTVITVFYFATLQLPHGQTSTVWLYDGNIPYVRGKHLALFIFALLFFILLFLPYNFLLVVGPWLQNISGERVNDPKFKALVRKVLTGWYEDYRIKSFVDTYTVAYNPGYQYWTGIFLILRCILFLIFATSAFRNSSATLMAVTTSLLAIVTLTRVFTGRVYKNWYIDILEGVFLLNLGILSVATSHNMMTGGNQQLVANFSGGISLVLFLLIVGYHVAKQAVTTDLYGRIRMKLMTKRRFHSVADHDDQQAQLLSHVVDNPPEVAPMTTIISVPST
jgi:predicted outer membrane repeat protein